MEKGCGDAVCCGVFMWAVRGEEGDSTGPGLGIVETAGEAGRGRLRL